MHIGMKQLLADVLRLIFPAEKVVGPAVRIRLDEVAHIGQRQSLIADGPSAGYARVHSGIGSGSFPVQVNSHLIALGASCGIKNDIVIRHGLGKIGLGSGQA